MEKGKIKKLLKNSKSSSLVKTDIYDHIEETGDLESEQYIDTNKVHDE